MLKKFFHFFSAVTINYSPSLLLTKKELADAQVKNYLPLTKFDAPTLPNSLS